MPNQKDLPQKKVKSKARKHFNKVKNCHPWPFHRKSTHLFPTCCTIYIGRRRGEEECLFLAAPFVWVYIKLSLRQCSFDKDLTFLQKITYGELLLTLLTQTNESWGTARLVTQTKARPADVSHSRQEEGTGRANSKELPHGKRPGCFVTHSAKKGTSFPLFLPSKLNLVAQPNLLLNSVSGEQQTQALASSCTDCSRNSWDILWQHHKKNFPQNW